ncbi:hypothetical protein BDR26DRAFT_1010834 [Obelidium mucronatum]|nr:hypothetical protein BDR26DRAFT_1010834 [Obelidium mucronatum]
MSITNMPAIILLTVSISHFTILSVAAQKVIAGALHLNPIDGPAKLESLAAEAPTLPITRLVLSFVRPDMVYIPGSASLKYSDLGYSRSGDFGFAAVKTAISRLQSGGVQVFLSMGGLSNNCYPYLSMKYSVAYFGSGADYWKIAKYGAGSPYKCTASNMWCQVCDFGKYMYNFADLSVFPEPNGTNTWDTARAKVMKLAKGAPVEWNPLIVGGYEYADPHDPSIATTVPGSGYWKVLKRDPYTDFIHLAKELKLDGVDLNYNEIWHEAVPPKGPFKLDQTVYKYSAIALDIMHAIQEIYPSCRFSATVDAKGAWQGTFWGGSLKGLWYYSNLWYPEIIQFMTNSELNGGGSQFANIEARLGFQVGQPSLPDPTVYAQHQLPLTASALFLLTQSSSSAFIWELFKPKNELPTGISGQPNNSSRCRGSIPEVGGELTGNMSPNIPLPTNTINTSQTNITTLNTFMTTNRNLKTTAFTEDVIITMPTASEPTVPYFFSNVTDHFDKRLAIIIANQNY